jgi:hypothetical protein
LKHTELLQIWLSLFLIFIGKTLARNFIKRLSVFREIGFSLTLH